MVNVYYHMEKMKWPRGLVLVDLMLPSYRAWAGISLSSITARAAVLGSAIRHYFLYRRVGPLRNIRRLNQVRVNSQTSFFFFKFYLISLSRSSPEFVGYLKLWCGKPGATSQPQGDVGREGDVTDGEGENRCSCGR